MDVKQLENFQLSMYDVQHQLKRHVYESLCKRSGWAMRHAI